MIVYSGPQAGIKTSAFALRNGDALQGLGLRRDRARFPFEVDWISCFIENKLWKMETMVEQTSEEATVVIQAGDEVAWPRKPALEW